MAVETSEEYRRYRRYFVDIRHLYQKKKVRIYTGVVLSILTTTFFLFFAIRPTVTTIASLIKEIKDKKEIAAKLQDKINALNSAQTEYQQVEKDLFLIDEALPQNANLSLFIRQLEALASKNNVAIQSIQFEETILKGKEAPTKPTKAKEKVEKREVLPGMNFSLAVAGDYYNLKLLLGSLSNLRRLVLIDGFSFQPVSKEEKNLILTLNARAYYLTSEQ